MKVLHIADLHFGKFLAGLGPEENQRDWCAKFVSLAKAEKPDAAPVAGDVYDRATPNGDAVDLLDGVLTDLLEADERLLGLTSAQFCKNQEAMKKGVRLMVDVSAVSHREAVRMLLGRIALRCKDDGCAFTDESRLRAIAEFLAGSKWSMLADGRLAKIWTHEGFDAGKPAVVISSHVDMVAEGCHAECGMRSVRWRRKSDLGPRGCWRRAWPNTCRTPGVIEKRESFWKSKRSAYDPKCLFDGCSAVRLCRGCD